MKYTFNFTEINYGSIVIDSDSKPGRAEVISTIENGGGFYRNTDYADISLVETERHNKPPSRKKGRGDR